MAWNPAPVLLRYPKILQAMTKRADTVNPTDTLSWHVIYLNMNASRKKYISASQQINTKYESYLHVCRSSNPNNIKILASSLLPCSLSILQCLFNTCCHTERLSAPRNHTLFLPSITAVRSAMLWILFPMLLPAFRMKDPSV